MFKLRTMVIDNDDSAHRGYVAALINGKVRSTTGSTSSPTIHV